MSPLYDSTFKGIFTQETDDSNLALQSFISAVLGRTVKNVILKPNEPAKDNTEQKGMSYDIMKLSDAFHEPQKEPLCEVKVRFLNIIGLEGKNLSVVRNCDMLKQYCEFMEIVFRYQAELKETPTTDEQKTCYEKAIREAISKGILVDYLTRKGTAVINMFTDEYDYNLDMQVKAEEAFDKGVQQGTQQKAIEAAINLLKLEVLTPEQIAQAQGLPLEKVLELQKNITVNA